MYKVTSLIHSICQKLRLNYLSPNYKKVLEYQSDANTLAKHYLKIKEIIGDLIEFETKYAKLNGLRNLFEKDVQALQKIDHDLVIEANKIIREKENQKGNK